MEDPRQYLSDNEEGFRLAFEGQRAGLWTAMPGIIQSINFAKQTCVVQLAIQGRFEDNAGNLNWVNIAPIQDVPIVFPSGGGFMVTFPLAAGDEVLVVFASRCIDAWWQSGGFANKPLEFRMHDLSDGFAIPGPKSVPNAFGSISSSDFQIRNKAGTLLFSLTATGQFKFQNSTTSLKTVLTNLNTALETFMTVLAGFSGGSSPVTQTMLQAPAAACETALTAVGTAIGALLE